MCLAHIIVLKELYDQNKSAVELQIKKSRGLLSWLTSNADLESQQLLHEEFVLSFVRRMHSLASQKFGTLCDLSAERVRLKERQQIKIHSVLSQKTQPGMSRGAAMTSVDTFQQTHK